MSSPSHGSLGFGSVLLALMLVVAAGGSGEAGTDGGAEAEANTCGSSSSSSLLSPRATQGTTDSREAIEEAAGKVGDGTRVAELPEVKSPGERGRGAAASRAALPPHIVGACSRSSMQLAQEEPLSHSSSRPAAAAAAAADYLLGCR